MFVTNFKANYQELKKYPNKISNKSTFIYFYCLLYQFSSRRHFLWMILYFYLKTYLPLKLYCWPLFFILNSNTVLVVRICVYISIVSNNKSCIFCWTLFVWDTPFFQKTINKICGLLPCAVWDTPFFQKTKTENVD